MPYNMFQYKYTMLSPVWQYMSMVLALRGRKHKDPASKVRLGYMASPCLKKPKPNKLIKQTKPKIKYIMYNIQVE